MTVTGRAGSAGRRAANSTPMEALARLGFVARGAIYVLVGVIALQIAFGSGGQADRGGAVARIADQSFGTAVLWVLAVGFAGLALWRLSEVAFGPTGGSSDGVVGRLKSAGRAVLYGFFCVTLLRFLLGDSEQATKNSNDQSQTWTARVMGHTGGRWLVGAAGLVLVGVGAYLAWQAWQQKFRKHLDLAGASSTTRTGVTNLGRYGGVARGTVAMVAGVFLVVAAVRFRPEEAEGVDGTLRTLAQSPLGPVLLVLVALGLVAFGLYSWCEARWRKVERGA
jgi:hypothetical protein